MTESLLQERNSDLKLVISTRKYSSLIQICLYVPISETNPASKLKGEESTLEESLQSASFLLKIAPP